MTEPSPDPADDVDLSDSDVGPAERISGWSGSRHQLRLAATVVRDRADILMAISAGGAVGALARLAVLDAAPHPVGSIAWNTVVINVSGSFLLGILMVVVLDVVPESRLLRPFAGVGVLGGYTTFSTATLDVHEMLRTGHAAEAGIYLSLSLLVGLVAVWAGLDGTRYAVRRLDRRRHPGPPAADS